MQLTLETWNRADGSEHLEEVGHTAIRMDDDKFQQIARTEQTLRQRDSSHEAFIDAEASKVQIKPPPGIGGLVDCKLRVYLNEEDRSGHFHLIARREADNSMVYTKAVMIKMVAL